MEPLIFIFAFFAGYGILLVALSKDESRKEEQLVSLKELVTVRKMGMYLFLIFFLVTMLQINTDYSTVAADISIATVMVTFAIALLIIALITDLIQITVFILAWINSRR